MKASVSAAAEPALPVAGPSSKPYAPPLTPPATPAAQVSEPLPSSKGKAVLIEISDDSSDEEEDAKPAANATAVIENTLYLYMLIRLILAYSRFA